MNPPIDHRSRPDAVMALFAACKDIESRADFMDWVYPLLQEVLPHERFVASIATVAPVAVLDVINAGFPAALIADVVDRCGRIAGPAIRRRLMSDAPVCFDETLGVFRRHHMRNLIAYGIKDLHGGATSYFCFAGAPAHAAARRPATG
jgi:hypothetical protein